MQLDIKQDITIPILFVKKSHFPHFENIKEWILQVKKMSNIT